MWSPCPSGVQLISLQPKVELMSGSPTRGVIPQFKRMDNEQSKPPDRYRRGQNITIQLVPPNDHLPNKAKRDIRTFKNHFIATL